MLSGLVVFAVLEYDIWVKLEKIFILSAVLVATLCSFGDAVVAAELQVAYIEYPPFSYSTDGKLDGILADSTRAVMERAGIDADYRSMPGKRIVTLMMAGEPLCAIAAFRTPGRESFAWFSPPTYRNAPLAVVHRSDDPRFSGKRTLDEVLNDPELILGLQNGYSLGTKLDRQISLRVRHVRQATADLEHLVRMIENERLDYAFLSPEGISGLLEFTGAHGDKISWFVPDGMPKGETRHIMCSRTVPEEVRTSIEEAVKAVPNPVWEKTSSD